MKSVIVLLLAATLSAQTAPPKLSDPFRRYDYIGKDLQILRPKPMFEQIMDQMNREAAECEASRPNPNPKPRKTGEGLFMADLTSIRTMDLYVSDATGNWVSIEPCGRLQMTPGMTAEQGLNMVMQIFRMTENMCETRVHNVTRNYEDALKAYEEYRRAIRDLMKRLGGPVTPKSGRKRG